MITTFSFPHPRLKDAHVVFLVESQQELTSDDKQKIRFIVNPRSSRSDDLNSVSRSLHYVGPNLRFETPESEKLCAICASCGLKVVQVEQFIAYSSTHPKAVEFDKMTQSLYQNLPTTLRSEVPAEKTRIVNVLDFGKSKLEEINSELGFGMDTFDIQYYYNLFVVTYQRNPTEVELAQLAQANSSHSRHWEWNGKFIIDGVTMQKTLFQLVKETLEHSPKGNILAFKDNGGILQGGWVDMFVQGKDGSYRKVKIRMNHTLTAETHNHPSLIYPYAGAATGVGGRLRDSAAILCGSLIGFGGVFFQTGKLWLMDPVEWNYPKNMADPRQVLADVIRGSFGYGNPYGEPTTMFGHDAIGVKLLNGQRFEFIKPNVYTCGIGAIPPDSKKKAIPASGMKIVRIGGKTWRVGTGGGAASSMDAGSNNAELDFKSVQRGEPMTGRSAYNVIKHCTLVCEENPILAIHDQGAGGGSNMLTELVHPTGGKIYMRRMHIGDKSLSQLEAWISESQELYGILIEEKDLNLLESICKQYECPIEVVGDVENTGRIVVIDELDNSVPVNLTLNEIIGDLPQKTYTDTTMRLPFSPLQLPDETVSSLLEKVFEVPGVTLIGYMVDHFDGSVGGKVVQGPRDGAYALPICPYAIATHGFAGVTGVASTIVRTNPVGMLMNEKATTRVAIANMVGTLAFIQTSGGIEWMKGRWNVMWPFKMEGMKTRLWNAYNAGVETLKEISFAMNGGKDSLSMQVSFEEQTVASFPTFIFLPQVHVPDVRKRITPSLKNNQRDKSTVLLLIELEECKYRMGGSALGEAFDLTGSEVPDVDARKVATFYKLVQRLVRKDWILSGTLKQKGGLLATIAKMSLASRKGVHLQSPDLVFDIPFYFNEEFGAVIECKPGYENKIRALVKNHSLVATPIGEVNSVDSGFEFVADGKSNRISMEKLSFMANLTSALIKKQLLNIPIDLVNEETVEKQNYKLTYNPDEKRKILQKKVFNVGVLAAPGTNGQDELGYMWGRSSRMVKVTPIQMSQLQSGEYDLKDFNVLLFAGGFSYGDVGESGKGWAASILFNEELKKMFGEFFARPDTLSFGVCNGFQLAAHLGVLKESLGQRVHLEHNDSGIFEHRLVNLLIPKNTSAIMFKGMGGSVLPAWSAHGEGKLYLPKGNYNEVLDKGLVCAQYANEGGGATRIYPQNPNGSPYGIAGLCSEDGRHLYMMPHIERFGSNVHLPYKPDDWKFKNPVWSRCIENMHQWLIENA